MPIRYQTYLVVTSLKNRQLLRFLGNPTLGLCTQWLRTFLAVALLRDRALRLFPPITRRVELESA